MNKIDAYHENVKHCQGLFPFNIFLCYLPNHSPIVNTHWHEDYEVIIVKNGCGIACIDLVNYDIKCDDIIFIDKNKLHSIISIDGNRLDYETIIFDGKIVYRNDSDYCNSRFFTPTLDGNHSLPIVISPSDNHYMDVKNVIARLDYYSEKQDGLYEIMIKSALTELFYWLLIIGNKNDFHDNSTKISMARKIALYISEHFSDALTIDSVSSHMGLSKSRFMAVFKESFNTTFTEYLNNLRLANANILLKESDDKIIDIAVCSGFSNLSYFNRLFKDKYGCTPREIRR